jgi:hypothetical protein
MRLLLALRSGYGRRSRSAACPCCVKVRTTSAGRFNLTAANAFMARSSLGLSDEQLGGC